MLLPATGLAQPVPCDWEALVEQGRQLGNEQDPGKWRAGHGVFQEAVRCDKNPLTSAYLGLSALRLGRLPEAETALEEALAGDVGELRPRLEVALTEARKGLGSLEVSCDVPGCEVWLDGSRLSALPLSRPLRLPARPLSVEVRAPGHLPQTHQVILRPAEVTRLKVALLATSPQAAAPRRKLAGWLLLSGAGVALLGGVAAQATREGLILRYNDDDRCLLPDGSTRDDACGGYRGSAAVAQGLSVTGFVVAAGLGAGALALLIPAYRGERKARVSLSPGPGQVGLSLTFGGATP